MKFSKKLLCRPNVISIDCTPQWQSDIDEEIINNNPKNTQFIKKSSKDQSLLTPALFKKNLHRRCIQKSTVKIIIQSDQSQSICINTQVNAMKKPFKKVNMVCNKVKLQKKEDICDTCPICLTGLNKLKEKKRACLPCNHKFCLDCILQASKFSNKCPYCRDTYLYIKTPYESILIEETNLNQDFEDPYNQPCYVCGRNDDFDRLLQCEFCEFAYCHTYCDNRLTNDRPPAQAWYCNSCQQIMRNQHELIEL